MTHRSRSAVVLAILAAFASTAFADSIPRNTAAERLPVRRVVLYKNGVGYFEHAGRVTGDEQLQIDFTTSQLNDVLQSLTALDLGGGQINRAGYNSTSPLSQQLRSSSLGLDENPSIAELFTALRGARVSVTGAGAPVTGKLMNIEIVQQKVKPDQDAIVEKRMLTVVSDADAVRVIELTPLVSVRLLDPGLHRDLSRYLDLLANSRSGELRHLTLDATGHGARDIRVSYISEVPVWKSTYRLLFDPGKDANHTDHGTALLQGWAVVDNTVGTDWDNVELSLVAGAAQSFIQPISTPYYTRRPEIGLPESAMTTPQTHESGDEVVVQAEMLDNQLKAPSRVPQKVESIRQDAAPPQVNGHAGIGYGPAGGVVGGIIGGLGAGSAGNTGGGSYRKGNAQRAPSMIESMIESQSPHVQSTAFDDYFEYKLAQPITLHKNQSALVPILQTKVDAERVTLWNDSQPEPLRALWLKNTSNLTLDRGSFTVLENNEFAGEGLIDPIHPGERRLLSYAGDEAVRITSTGKNQPQHLRHIKVADGILTDKEEEADERTYSVRNSATDARNVILEHPMRDGWELTSDTKPEETTSGAYRFRLFVKPGESEKLHVSERRVISQRTRLTSANDYAFEILQRGAQINPAVLHAIQPVLDAVQHYANVQSQYSAVKEQLNSLEQDEKRIRDNLTAMKDTDKTAQHRFVDELNKSEDQIQQVRLQQVDLATQQKAAQKALNDAIAAVQIDTDI